MVICLSSETLSSFFRSVDRSLHPCFHRLRDCGRFILVAVWFVCSFGFTSGFVSTKQCSDRFNRCIVRYLLCSIVAIFLLLLATQLRSEKGVLVASAIIGFFLSVPYALMEMVIMRECGRFSVSRMLSVASLNTQLAGTVAGYPAGRLLQLTGFEAAPAVEAGMLGVATMCLVVVERVKGKEKGE